MKSTLVGLCIQLCHVFEEHETEVACVIELIGTYSRTSVYFSSSLFCCGAVQKRWKIMKTLNFDHWAVLLLSEEHHPYAFNLFQDAKIKESC